MTAPLVTDRISFAYGDRHVLRDVSLVVEAGEFVGLIGANGSGKTTLLRVLLGFLRATRGEVRLCGSPLGSLTRREIALRATMIQQDARMDFAFSGREVVAMGRTPYLGRFTAESRADRDAIHLAMRMTQTEEFASRPVTELSGGERQRLHLARALAQGSSLLLLDEPTANLDLAYQFEALSLIQSVTRQGQAALAALHDIPLAARFCDRLLILSDGRIVAAGPPAEVVTERNLADYFGLKAIVRRDDADNLLVSPLGVNRPLKRRADNCG